MTITGTGFTGASAVDFGPAAGTIVTVSATTITAYSPAGTGTVDVTVTTPNGTSATSPADQFMYVAAPTVTGVVPTSGPAGGGTFVTITGTGFTGATEVDFGTTPATDVTVVSATTITAESPAGTGTVDVTVVAPGGRSATSSADQFHLHRRADGFGREPGLRSGGRRHSGDDHRHRLHRCHGGRLRFDAGDGRDRRQRHHDHGRQPRGHRRGGRNRDGAGRDIGHLARGYVHLRTDGHRHQPEGWSAGRRYVGDDHRDGLHRRHGGRLRHDAGDDLHRGQPHVDHGLQSRGHRHRGRDRDVAERNVGDLDRRSVHIRGRTDGFGHQPDRPDRRPAALL